MHGVARKSIVTCGGGSGQLDGGEGTVHTARRVITDALRVEL
jgi:hypothetical protein